jgi:solute carrier family 35 protein C2
VISCWHWLSLVSTDKWMFSPDHYNFQYPLFVSACHMYIQFGLAALTLALFPSIRSRTRPTSHDYLSVNYQKKNIATLSSQKQKK